VKKIIIYVFLMVAVSFAQQNNRIKIGLALRGGGALGFAHIGVDAQRPHLVPRQKPILKHPLTRRGSHGE